MTNSKHLHAVLLWKEKICHRVPECQKELFTAVKSNKLTTFQLRKLMDSKDAGGDMETAASHREKEGKKSLRGEKKIHSGQWI